MDCRWWLLAAPAVGSRTRCGLRRGSVTHFIICQWAGLRYLLVGGAILSLSVIPGVCSPVGRRLNIPVYVTVWMQSMTTDPLHGSPSSPSCRLCRRAASRRGLATKVYSFTRRSSKTERNDKYWQETAADLKRTQEQLGFRGILIKTRGCFCISGQVGRPRLVWRPNQIVVLLHSKGCNSETNTKDHESVGKAQHWISLFPVVFAVNLKLAFAGVFNRIYGARKVKFNFGIESKGNIGIETFENTEEKVPLKCLH